MLGFVGLEGFMLADGELRELGSLKAYWVLVNWDGIAYGFDY